MTQLALSGSHVDLSCGPDCIQKYVIAKFPAATHAEEARGFLVDVGHLRDQ